MHRWIKGRVRTGARRAGGAGAFTQGNGVGPRVCLGYKTEETQGWLKSAGRGKAVRTEKLPVGLAAYLISLNTSRRPLWTRQKQTL